MANTLLYVYESIGLLTNLEIRQVHVCSRSLVRPHRHAIRNCRKGKIVSYSTRLDSTTKCSALTSPTCCDAKMVHNKIWWQIASAKASGRACERTRKHLSTLHGHSGYMLHALLAAIPARLSAFDFWPRSLCSNILLLKVFIYMWNTVTRRTPNCVLKWNDLFRGAIPVFSLHISVQCIYTLYTVHLPRIAPTRFFYFWCWC